MATLAVEHPDVVGAALPISGALPTGLFPTAGVRGPRIVALHGTDDTRIPFDDYDAGVWHAFVHDLLPGQLYGFRVTGPYAPSQGLRCNPAKLLLDPYAKATTGSVRFGHEVFGYDVNDPNAPSDLDSVDHVPRTDQRAPRARLITLLSTRTQRHTQQPTRQHTHAHPHLPFST